MPKRGTRRLEEFGSGFGVTHVLEVKIPVAKIIYFSQNDQQ